MTGMSYVESFQSALVIILIEGIVFIVLSILNIRDVGETYFPALCVLVQGACDRVIA